MLEKIVSDAITAKGHEAKWNDNIDLYFKSDHEHVIIEIKSCHKMNLHSQIRRGVSQLLEYRYLYEDQLKDIKTLALIIEIEPVAEKQWLIDYLETLGITLAWKKIGEDKIITSSTIPESLKQIVQDQN